MPLFLDWLVMIVLQAKTMSTTLSLLIAAPVAPARSVATMLIGVMLWSLMRVLRAVGLTTDKLILVGKITDITMMMATQTKLEAIDVAERAEIEIVTALEVSLGSSLVLRSVALLVWAITVGLLMSMTVSIESSM